MIPSYLSLALFSCLSFAVAEPLHVPLMRRRSPLSVENYVNAVDHGHGRHVRSSISKRQNSATIPVINQKHDFTYLCAVRVGTPPQSFNVIIDTGISDLWVMTSACTSCNPDATGFNNASSTTFKAAKDSTGQPTRISITYGAGPVVGDLVQDTVAMGAFQVQSQPWVLADQVPATVLDGSGSGAMGLAFDSIAYTGATPFWQSLAQGGMLATPEMSFWLTRLLGDQSAQNEDFGGVFTLGGRNQTLYTGDVDFLPLVTNAGRKTSWLINVSEVTVNKKNISLSSGSVGYIVTGTTLIGAPTAAVSAIYAQIPDSQVLSGNFSGYYGIPCDTPVEVTMAFGGRSWPIDPRDMSFERVTDGSNVCLGGVFDLQSLVPGTEDNVWVVGTAFLKNVYTVLSFQPPGVGFAELSVDAGGSSGVPRGDNGSGNTDGGDNTNSSTSAAVLLQVPSTMLLAAAISLFACLFRVAQ